MAATAAATPEPVPLYLPVILRESCHERPVYADVALGLAIARLPRDLAQGTRLDLALDIGFGQSDATNIAHRINADLPRAIATEPNMSFETLDAGEIARIFAEIADRLGCPPTAFWGRRDGGSCDIVASRV